MTVEELIAALERCEGPDRKLDMLIAEAQGYEARCVLDEAVEPRIIEQGIGYLCRTPGEKSWRPISRYTSSLTAALSCIPDGLYWLLGKGRTCPTEPLHGMQLFLVIDDGSFDSGDPFVESEHENRELCVCIAALKARQHMEP